MSLNGLPLPTFSLCFSFLSFPGAEPFEADFDTKIGLYLPPSSFRLPYSFLLIFLSYLGAEPFEAEVVKTTSHWVAGTATQGGGGRTCSKPVGGGGDGIGGILAGGAAAAASLLGYVDYKFVYYMV